jgi:pyroglutamyl-peptidase
MQQVAMGRRHLARRPNYPVHLQGRRFRAVTGSRARIRAMREPVVLVTGFEPFGGDALNPSWLVAQSLQGRRIAGARIQALQLPCVFGDAIAVLQDALAEREPVLVLALGLAAGRAELSIERVAINVDDARIPDNAGWQPVDSAIDPAGPAAHFSTLPIKAMVAALQAEGVAAGVSQTAGTFVCNHVFYGLQHLLADTPVRSGFMHVPLLPEQASAHPGLPTMALADMVRGTRRAIEVALRHGSGDRVLVGGALS